MWFKFLHSASSLDAAYVGSRAMDYQLNQILIMNKLCEKKTNLCLLQKNPHINQMTHIIV